MMHTIPNNIPRSLKHDLTPFELYDFSKTVHLYPKEVIDRYCTTQINMETLLPVVTLNTGHVPPDDTPLYNEILHWIFTYFTDSEVREYLLFKSNFLANLMSFIAKEHPEKVKAAQDSIILYLYQSYDLFQPFLIQYDNNFGRLMATLI